MAAGTRIQRRAGGELGLADRLWKTATPAAIKQIVGHSRVSTTLKYGQPTDDDLRAALEEAGQIR